MWNDPKFVHAVSLDMSSEFVELMAKSSALQVTDWQPSPSATKLSHYASKLELLTFAL